MLRHLPIKFAALLLFAQAAAASDIYGAVDADGTPHFTNVPDSARYKLVLRNRDDYKVKADPRYRLRTAEAEIVFDESRPFAELISREAQSNHIDPFLVDAVIAVESGHNPGARSPKGALGLMQVMPDTALRYGIVDVAHPDNNIRAGTRYLRDLLTMFEGDVQLALAAYNAGENAVKRYGNRIPPFAETRDYVPRVLKKYDELRVRVVPAKAVIAAPLKIRYRAS